MRTILSQNTSDRNRDVAFGRLRERFPDLGGGPRRARGRGRSRRSGPAGWPSRRRRGSRPSLRRARRRHARPRLARDGAARRGDRATSPGCPGSGARPRPASRSSPAGSPRSRSTSTCTGSAVGSASSGPAPRFEEAHDEMLAITDPADAYELHMNLIRHGREVCRPRPRCQRVRAAPHVPVFPRGPRGLRKVISPRRSALRPAHEPQALRHLRTPRWPCSRCWSRSGPSGSTATPRTGAADLPAEQEQGKQLFDANCGTCHTLYAAGTDGNFGPNLDQLLAPTGPPTGARRRTRSKRPGAASSARSRTASTAPPHRAGCRRDPRRPPGRAGRRVRRADRRPGLSSRREAPQPRGRSSVNGDARRWRLA